MRVQNTSSQQLTIRHGFGCIFYFNYLFHEYDEQVSKRNFIFHTQTAIKACSHKTSQIKKSPNKRMNKIIFLFLLPIFPPSSLAWARRQKKQQDLFKISR